MGTSRVEVDLSAVEHNVRLFRRMIGADGAPAPAGATAAPGAASAPGATGQRVQVCAIIKQDGYGMGAARLARKLASIGSGQAGPLVDMLAVYCLDEARALCDAPIKAPVLILMPVESFDRADALYRLAVVGRLHLTLHSERQALELATLAGRVGVNFPVHVQVDTGMSRGGCVPSEAARLVELVCASNRLRLAGVMTHFSAPGEDEPFTREQARLFRQLVETIKPLLAADHRRGRPPIVVHAANTAATIRSDGLHGTMVRIGQGLLGYGGDDAADGPQFAAEAGGLRPAVRWVSRIVHVQDVPEGWPVGYGRTWHAGRASRIALVPAGYADGYPVGLGNKGQVRLTGLMYDRPRTHGPMADLAAIAAGTGGGGGVMVPVVGRVSMDQITLDVTGLPDELAGIGREVELIGHDPAAANHPAAMAATLGVVKHSLLCGISPALERTYLTGSASSVGGAGDDPSAAGPAIRGQARLPATA